MVVEKHNSPYEKVCGGGVSYKAIDLLSSIGMDTKKLFDLDCSLVSGHTIFRGDSAVAKTYADGNVSIGIQRKLFDAFLLEQAKEYGVEIAYGEDVLEVERNKQTYNINDYAGKDIIWAIGARAVNGFFLKGQSIGISAIIQGKFDLDNRRFYYWYEPEIQDRYFWTFPVGIDKWNVGVWSRRTFPNMMKYYEKCISAYFLNHSLGAWCYIYSARAEFLGHIDQRKEGDKGVGDYAGLCNERNGGGIIPAICSAINISKLL